MINLLRSIYSGVPTEEETEATSPLDEVMEEIRLELVRRVAAEDRDVNRDIYDAPKDE